MLMNVSRVETDFVLQNYNEFLSHPQNRRPINILLLTSYKFWSRISWPTRSNISKNATSDVKVNT